MALQLHNRPAGVPADRVKQWEIALALWIEKARRRRFQWGQFDCGLAAADCVLALTGVDVAADLRGSYDDEEGASLTDLEAICDERLGERISPLMARKGDIVMGSFDDGRVKTLMVDNGKTYLVACDPDMRLVRKDAINAVTAWRVG